MIKKEVKKAFGENHFSSKVYTFNIPKDNTENNEITEQIKIGVVGLALKMQENQIAGKGFEEIIFLDYKDELVNEANKLRKENKVNIVILLSHIPIN